MISRKEVTEKQKGINEALNKILIKYPGIDFIDQNKIFINTDEDFIFKKDNLPLLRDISGHLSEFGSEILSNHLSSTYHSRK
jgi:hypothetical protein